MAIMRWNTPPKDTHTERAPVTGHGDNAVLVYEAFGDPVQGGAQVNTDQPNFELATRWSTAPYRDTSYIKDGYRDQSRQGRCTANDDTCNGWATKASDMKWCGMHAIHMAKQDE